MRRALAILLSLASLVCAADLIELRAPAQRGNDYFRYFMADDGSRENGSQHGNEYTAYVADDGRLWGPVYMPGGEEEPVWTNEHMLAVMALAPEAETPEGSGGWVGGQVTTDVFFDPNHGEVTLDAEPLPGFTFSHWAEQFPGSRVSYDPHYTYAFNAGSSHSWFWIAYFDGAGTGEDTNEYVTVSASVAEDGGGTASGGGTLIRGRDFAVIATPDANHVFDRWTEGGSDVSRSMCYSGTADRDRALVAHFKPAPRRITCNVNAAFEDPDTGLTVNKAWVASAGERSFGENTHTVEANDGERVTIKARVAPKPNAVVIKTARSNGGKYADHDDSWTLTHTFTVGGDEDWIVYFREQRAEIICNGSGTILYKGANDRILRLQD